MRPRVLLLNSDEGGCGNYRMLMPGGALEGDPNVEVTLGTKTTVATDHDVVVFQKTPYAWRVDAIPELQRRGIAVVMEVDDDYWDGDTRNPATKELRSQSHINIDHLTRGCQLADLVIVSTPDLAKRIPNRNVRVLRNCVPESYLSLEPDPDIAWSLVERRPLVAWTGSLDYHPGDLAVPGNSTIAHAVRKAGASFVGIGDERIGPKLGFCDGEALFVDWLPFHRYARVLKGADIGIIPLEDNRFNRAKSWLKGMEMNALGIPWVASPMPEYLELARLGCGLLAKKPRDWMLTLSALLADTSCQEDMAHRGRLVASEWTYEKKAYLWAEAWTDALRVRRGTQASVG